jgi:hypothetical protein
VWIEASFWSCLHPIDHLATDLKTWHLSILMKLLIRISFSSLLFFYMFFIDRNYETLWNNTLFELGYWTFLRVSISKYGFSLMYSPWSESYYSSEFYLSTLFFLYFLNLLGKLICRLLFLFGLFFAISRSLLFVERFDVREIVFSFFYSYL